MIWDCFSYYDTGHMDEIINEGTIFSTDKLFKYTASLFRTIMFYKISPKHWTWN